MSMMIRPLHMSSAAAANPSTRTGRAPLPFPHHNPITAPLPLQQQLLYPAGPAAMPLVPAAPTTTTEVRVGAEWATAGTDAARYTGSGATRFYPPEPRRWVLLRAMPYVAAATLLAVGVFLLAVNTTADRLFGLLPIVAAAQVVATAHQFTPSQLRLHDHYAAARAAELEADALRAVPEGAAEKATAEETQQHETALVVTTQA